MTKHLDREARNSEDIDVIQQVGGGLLSGMSHLLYSLTRDEVTDTKQIDRLPKINERLRKVNETKI